MLLRILKSAIRILLLVTLLLPSVVPAFAQDDDAAQILARINALRQQSGLLPLDLNSMLTAAAQSHSDDMARTGNIDHTGSDGSTIDSRIRSSGYGHWRDFGIWGENIYGGQMANVESAWNFWIGSQVHRANLLNQRYREIGIGVGHGANGGTYYTLNFGAQPNALPFFVTGSAPNVTLLLTNENDITTGEGVAIMGQATQVRIAEGTNTTNAGWQPWAQSIPFQLSDTPGPITITVEYRDELGRGTKTTRTIDVSNLASATPTTEPSATPTAKPTATTTRAASPTGTVAPTSTGTGVPTLTVTPQATATLQPTETPTPPPTETPSPTGTPSETPASSPTAVPTTTPTTVLVPFVLPTSTATATLQRIVANLATLPAGSRLTPPAPRPAPTERPLFDFTASPGVSTFALLIGLQVIALGLLGVIFVVRLRRH